MSFGTMTPKEFGERVRGGEDLLLVDVREPEEYELARVGGARLLPLSLFNEWAPTLDPDRPCGRIVASVPQRTAVAWRLGLPIPEIRTTVPPRPVTVLRARPYAGGPLEPPPTGTVVGTAPRWELRERC